MADETIQEAQPVSSAAVVSDQIPQVQNLNPENQAPQNNNNPIAISTIAIALKTVPYFVLRTVAYIVIAALFSLLVFLFVFFQTSVIGIGENGDSGIGQIIALLGGAFLLFVFIAAFRFVRSTMLYFVKAGHIAVVTEIVMGRKLPDGQGQISYGSSAVKQRFQTSAVMWVLDNLINKAVQEIKVGLGKITDSLNFIPGMEAVQGFLNVFVTIFLGYSDEAVFAHIFQSGEIDQQKQYKAAADGIVLYAQNWGELMKRAAVMSLVLIAAGIGAAGAAFGAYSLSVSMNWPYAFIIYSVVVVIFLVKWIFVDPFVMIYVVKHYLEITSGQQPSIDLYSKLQSISKKFSSIMSKSSEANTVNNGGV